MQNSRATLIRRHLLGETSLILCWCTENSGLVRTAAKGARGPRSGFAGKLDLFFDAEIAWIPARRGDLHSLREVVLVDARLGLRESYQQTLAAAYFTSLIEMIAETDTPIPELHALLIRALDWLALHPPVAAAIYRFEDRVADLLGLGRSGIGGAAALLEMFHRLPPSRQQLFIEIQPKR